MMSEDLLWPRYAVPADLTAIEAVPLVERGLPETTYALLDRAASRWPERIAVAVLPEAARWAEPVRRTFGELIADVHRFGNVLHAVGVRRSDAVALMSPNCDELITATLAAELAGIAAPLNGGLNRAHLAELLRRCGARVLVAAGPELDPAVWETARELAPELDVILVLRPSGAEGAAAALPMIPGVRVEYLAHLAATKDPAAFAGTLPKSSDLAAVFHTGGTTGAPKQAGHTHANEISDAWMLAANSLFDADSTVFAALPLFHVNALVVTLLAPLFKGQPVVWAGPLGYREPALLGQFWKILEHYRIAAMSAVPTVYATLARIPVDADISSLRVAMVGASPLPAAVRDAFHANTRVYLLEGYGLTEATCASARSFPDAQPPGSVGQRLPYQRVRTVRVTPDGQWADVPTGQVGLLVIDGPTIFAGYLTGRDGDSFVLDGLGKLVEGWLDTGDLARIDDDGFIYLTGRAKDLIIRGGHNIDPAVVEDALLAHPQVTAASAVGRPDAHAGEVPVAYVTLAPDATLTGDELCEFAAARVAERAAAPKAVTVLDALPVTTIGKPDKLALRANATARAVADALAKIAHTEVETTIQDGSVITTVTVAPDTDPSAVTAALDQYALSWQLEVRTTNRVPAPS